MSDSGVLNNFGLASNSEYLEQLYQQWKSEPSSVSPEMAGFFKGIDFACESGWTAGGGGGDDQSELQAKVDLLVSRYRDIGHHAAFINPLEPATPLPLLELEAVGLSEEHLDRTFDPYRFGGLERTTLREIIAACRETYCGPIGVQCTQISDVTERRWLQQFMENRRNRPNLTREERFRALGQLRRAERFEDFLQEKFKGQKRFSLEGAETLLLILNQLVYDAAADDAVEIVMGMPHRGRLNVLTNVLQKSLSMVFAEFEDNFISGSVFGDGDVKYHVGYSSDIKTDKGELHISLAANPSHLEMVGAVVQGKVRSKQAHLRDAKRERVIPVVMHGDAAFCGQGIVAELLQMSQLDGYNTGGTIHIIINNQIGFTTSPSDARSTKYASDMAKIISAPAIQVNANYPESVMYAAKVAYEYRQKFHKDIVIDLICYRRYGHNEGDEPKFTHPKMYAVIESLKSVSEVYAGRLVKGRQIEESEIVSHIESLDKSLEDEMNKALDISHRSCQFDPRFSLSSKWAGIKPEYREVAVDTGVQYERLKEVTAALNHYPENFHPHPKIARIFKNRMKTMEDRGKLDWAFAETLAFGSLMQEGTLVRVSGQDSRRGTFSQRHAAIYDSKTGERFIPLLANLKVPSERPLLRVWDSPLSEQAVLGFEYGYSLADPHRLVIWEAQFGDFANGAQVIIDQFIASSISKWGRYSGLVMLLPHGYEGQGPEHSSARLERFLQLCAEDNIQVAYPTTPAQYFHLLRRQLHRDFRRSLVVMTPKSMLRNPLVTSTVDELENGSFQTVLDDPAPPQKKIRRLALCSGKIYYDLIKKRQDLDEYQTAIARIEFLYPFPEAALQVLAENYSDVEEIVWVQEESENMGAWQWVEPRLRKLFNRDILYIGRDASASPAVASHKRHLEEQDGIVSRALQTKKLNPAKVNGDGVAVKYA